MGGRISPDPPSLIRVWSPAVSDTVPDSGMSVSPVCPAFPPVSSVVTRSGRRLGGGCGWAGCGAEQVGLDLFPCPVGGSIQVQSTSGRGDPGRDVDQVFTQRGPAGAGVPGRGGDTGGASNVERDRRVPSARCLDPKNGNSSTVGYHLVVEVTSVVDSEGTPHPGGGFPEQAVGAVGDFRRPRRPRDRDWHTPAGCISAARPHPLLDQSDGGDTEGFMTVSEDPAALGLRPAGRGLCSYTCGRAIDASNRTYRGWETTSTQHEQTLGSSVDISCPRCRVQQR